MDDTMKNMMDDIMKIMPSLIAEEAQDAMKYANLALKYRVEDQALADLFMRSDIVELVYTIGFKQSRHGQAAAMSVIFILMNVLVIAIAALLIRKVVFYYDE